MPLEPPYHEIEDALLERLVAYTDGRLEPAQVAEIERLIEQDATVEALVADLRETGERLKQTLAFPEPEEPSQHLVDLVMTTPLGKRASDDSDVEDTEPDQADEQADQTDSDAPTPVVPLPTKRSNFARPVIGGLIAASVAAGLFIVVDRFTDLQIAGQDLADEVDRLTAAIEARELEVAERGVDLAQLQRERDELVAALTNTQDEIGNLMTALVEAGNVKADTELRLAEANDAAEGLRQSLQTAMAANWLVQVAQYHQVFAQQPPRRWVEVSTADEDKLGQFLEDMADQLGRPTPVPDLSDPGLKFMGARMLVINGMPTAQLMYRDPNGEPLAFCLTPDTAGERDLARSRAGDLELIDWHDRSYRYVVVGSADSGLLVRLATEIRELYSI